MVSVNVFTLFHVEMDTHDTSAVPLSLIKLSPFSVTVCLSQISHILKSPADDW